MSYTTPAPGDSGPAKKPRKKRTYKSATPEAAKRDAAIREAGALFRTNTKGIRGNYARRAKAYAAYEAAVSAAWAVYNTTFKP